MLYEVITKYFQAMIKNYFETILTDQIKWMYITMLLLPQLLKHLQLFVITSYSIHYTKLYESFVINLRIYLSPIKNRVVERAVNATGIEKFRSSFNNLKSNLKFEFLINWGRRIKHANRFPKINAFKIPSIPCPSFAIKYMFKVRLTVNFTKLSYNFV